MHPSLIIQCPTGMPAQLFLLFHDAGADERSLETLGLRIAAEFSSAMVVSIGASTGAEVGTDRQWFSIRDMSAENRPERVAAALPAFLATVRHWQKRSGVGAESTAFVGFSQGATMALEAAHAGVGGSSVAGRVISIAGRFATLPKRAILDLTLHLIHGKADTVVPYGHTVAAAEHLIPLGADLTADVLPFVGHEINDDIEILLVNRLKTYVPRRIWEAAIKAG